MSKADGVITCVMVLYDNQIVTWKAGYSITIHDMGGVSQPLLNTKYYPDVPHDKMQHVWAEFHGGEEKWEAAHEWMRCWPIHPESRGGFSAHGPGITCGEAQGAVNGVLRDGDHEKRLQAIEAMLIQAEEELRLELSIGNPLAKELIERLREAEEKMDKCSFCNPRQWRSQPCHKDVGANHD